MSFDTCSRTSASFLLASASADSIWSFVSLLRRVISSFALLRCCAIVAVASARCSDSSRSCVARSEARRLLCSSREFVSSRSSVWRCSLTVFAVDARSCAASCWALVMIVCASFCAFLSSVSALACASSTRCWASSLALLISVCDWDCASTRADAASFLARSSSSVLVCSADASICCALAPSEAKVLSVLALRFFSSCSWACSCSTLSSPALTCSRSRSIVVCAASIASSTRSLSYPRSTTGNRSTIVVSFRWQFPHARLVHECVFSAL